MARGYPDYFGYSTFFKYGQLQTPPLLTANVLAGTTADLWNLNYKGRTYAGFIRINFLADPDNDVTVFVTIDGEVGYQLNTLAIFERHLFYPGVGPLYMIYRCEDGLTVNFVIEGDLTFDQNFIISVENLSAGGALIQGELWVARVT